VYGALILVSAYLAQTLRVLALEAVKTAFDKKQLNVLLITNNAQTIKTARLVLKTALVGGALKMQFVLGVMLTALAIAHMTSHAQDLRHVLMLGNMDKMRLVQSFSGLVVSIWTVCLVHVIQHVVGM